MRAAIDRFRAFGIRTLRRLERVTHTDNVYLAKGLSAIGSSQVFALVSGLIQYVVLARFVTPDAFGSYKYLISIFELAAIFSLTGAKIALIRSASRGYTGALRDAFRLRMRTGYVLGLPLLALAAYSASRGDRLLAFGYAATYALGPLVYAASSYVPFLQGMHAFRALGRWLILQELALFAFIVGTAILSGRAGFMFLAYLATMSITLVGYAAARRAHANGPSDPELKSHAVHQSWLDVFQTVAGRIDSAILFNILGPVQVAQYAFAVLTADQIKGLLSSLYTVAGPKLAARPIAEILPSFFRKMALFGALGAISAAVYGILASFIYRLLFPNYLAVVDVSRLYVWSLVFVLPALLGGYLLNLQNARREATLYNVISYGALIVLLVIGGVTDGVTGIIWARIAGSAVQLVVVIWLLMRLRKQPH